MDGLESTAPIYEPKSHPSETTLVNLNPTIEEEIHERVRIFPICSSSTYSHPNSLAHSAHALRNS
jgi:hypothetical protein